MGVVPFLEGELTARGIHLNPGKTVALAPKGHVPTPEERSLLAGVSVRIADEGGIKVVGVLHRYKLALRERQATRRGREEEGRLMPMAWGCHIGVDFSEVPKLEEEIINTMPLAFHLF